MSYTSDPLWIKLQKFNLDDPESKFPFSARLAKENGWTKEYTSRVIEEYKKFLYLSTKYKKSFTPSDQVDQAWHLHMIYTESYWLDLCFNLLDTKLHHGPTKGGNEERTKYDNLYSHTLTMYALEFNEAAPRDIWALNEERFSHINFRRVDTDRYFILPKKMVKYTAATLLLPIFALLLLSNTTVSEVDVEGTIFLIIAIILGLFILRGIYRLITRDERKGGSSGGDSGGDILEAFTDSFFGCGGSSGCSSSGCSSSGCSSSGCGGGCGGGCS